MTGVRALRVVIVDDEQMAIDRLQLLLDRIENAECVATASDGEGALATIAEAAADVVILDINMPRLSGIDVAEVIQAMEAPPAIIFATAYDDHAIRAFELAATDYLLKPVGLARLQQAIDRVRAAQPVPQKRSAAYIREFWVRHRSDMLRVDVDQVDHIEAERDYMRLHTAAGSYLVHETVKALERRLDPDCFIRTHRSHIFRRAAITRLEHDGLGVWNICTGNGAPVRVGRTYLADVKALLKQQ